jgi:hypothetical protein
MTSDQGQRVLPSCPKPIEGLNDLKSLVERFSIALLAKMELAEKKYGFNHGYLRDDWADELRANIRKHVDRGDPRDVAAYCAFAWLHGWSLTVPNDAPPDHPPSILSKTETVGGAGAQQAVAIRKGVIVWRCDDHGYGGEKEDKCPVCQTQGKPLNPPLDSDGLTDKGRRAWAFCKWVNGNRTCSRVLSMTHRVWPR